MNDEFTITGDYDDVCWGDDMCACDMCLEMRMLAEPTQNKVEQVMACVETVKARGVPVLREPTAQQVAYAQKALAKEIAAKEDALLTELLAKRGMVAVPQVEPVAPCTAGETLVISAGAQVRFVGDPAEALRLMQLAAVDRGETVLTEQKEPTNNSPAGLLRVSATPGLRMGNHAWVQP